MVCDGEGPKVKSERMVLQLQVILKREREDVKRNGCVTARYLERLRRAQRLIAKSYYDLECL